MFEFEFEFAFGKKKRTIFDWVKLGVLLNFSIDTAAMLPWFSRKQVFNLVDSLQLKANYDFLNEYIINDSEFLSYRLERELNRAIEDYEDYEL